MLQKKSNNYRDGVTTGLYSNPVKNLRTTNDGDAGGDGMIQHVCDRCGAVINPTGSAVFVTVQNGNVNAFENKSELCCSCGMWLKRFLECKAKIVDGKEAQP